MSKPKLIARLNWYFPTERFNVFLFTSVMVFIALHFRLRDVLALLYGLLLMTFVLFQGQQYWKLKLFRLTNKFFDGPKNLRLFKKARRLNAMMIALIPFVFLVQLFLAGWRIQPKNLFWWGVAANAFGVLEYINYFHRQLMIDTVADLKWIRRNKRLKIASLRKDLDENEI